MKTRILIIDDEETFLDECLRNLEPLGYICEACKSAEEGYERLHSDMFDIFICDVLIPFRGRREGGMIIAQEFSEKYPTSSIILVSQYVTARWVNMLSGMTNYLFLEKGDAFFDDLKVEIEKIIKNKYCFVCMPFQGRFDDIYHLGIKPTVEELGFKCERADEIQHNRGILEIIYKRIDMAHVVIGDMSDQNPNVYYEIGYAHALGKEVILITQKIEDIPFDLRGYNHIIYGGSITALKGALHDRMKTIFNPRV